LPNSLASAPIAVIAGATGLTGSFVVRQLLDDDSIGGVISVSRRSVGISSPKLREVLMRDLSELPSVSSQLAGQLYFCCLGTTIGIAGSQRAFEQVDHDAVVAFAKIAAEHKAHAFALVSAMGADARSRIFYNRVKGRTEDDVKALSLRSLTMFRPGLLVGPRVEYRRSERMATMLLLPISKVLPGSMRRALITEVPHLAEEMLVAAKRATPGTHVVRSKDI
jgi:uncharacterized protein YbjT (DUF2867 family)